MKPVKFKHQNIVMGKNQPEYTPLPALKIKSLEGEVISCWKMSFFGRLKVLFTGKVWLNIVTFNHPVTPSFMSVNRKDCFTVPGDRGYKPPKEEPKVIVDKKPDIITGKENKIIQLNPKNNGSNIILPN